MTLTQHRLAMTLQETIWGGRKLAAKFGKGDGLQTRIAESWETCDELAELPMLLKWIDTDLPTSVPVHPSREVSANLGFSCDCENEIWIIVEAEPEGRLGIGFHETVTRDEILKALHERTLELLMNNVQPQTGDCFVIPPGTLHALEGGVTLLEITSKESVILRLYDWLRDVSTGREVQVAESLTAMSFQGMTPSQTYLPGREEPYRVSRGKYLVELRWHEIKCETQWNESADFRLLTLLEGNCEMNQQEKLLAGETVLLSEGETVLNPGAKTCVVLETILGGETN